MDDVSPQATNGFIPSTIKQQMPGIASDDQPARLTPIYILKYNEFMMNVATDAQFLSQNHVKFVVVATSEPWVGVEIRGRLQQALKSRNASRWSAHSRGQHRAIRVHEANKQRDRGRHGRTCTRSNEVERLN